MNSFPHPPPHHDGGHQHQQPYSAPSSPLPLTPQRSTKHIWFGLGGLVIGLLLGVGTVGGIVGISSLAEADAQAARAELMADGYETCSLGSVDGATLSADRLSVDFDGAGMYFGPDLADVYCLGDALGHARLSELPVMWGRHGRSTEHRPRNGTRSQCRGTTTPMTDSVRSSSTSRIRDPSRTVHLTARCPPGRWPAPRSPIGHR